MGIFEENTMVFDFPSKGIVVNLSVIFGKGFSEDKVWF